MQINQHNYEDFFLLYIDNELSFAEREMVEAFVKTHATYQTALTELSQSILIKEENIIYPRKEHLLKSLPLSKEDLLTYLDGEADKSVQAHIDSLSSQKELIDLKKLYVQPDKTIVFSKKDALYRRATVKKMNWWKISVAAALLTTLSIWALLHNNEEDVQAPFTLATDTTQQHSNQLSLNNHTSSIITEDYSNAHLPVSNTINNNNNRNTLQPTNKKREQPSTKTTAAVETAIIETPAAAEIENQTSQLKETPEVNTSAISITNVNKEMPSTQTTVVSNTNKQEKKDNFFKKIGKKIGDRALDILTDGGDEINVAGFAIDVRK